jgi:hypothetical protein
MDQIARGLGDLTRADVTEHVVVLREGEEDRADALDRRRLAADEQIDRAGHGATNATGERGIDDVDAGRSRQFRELSAGLRPHRSADDDDEARMPVRDQPVGSGHDLRHVVVERHHDERDVGRGDIAEVGGSPYPRCVRIGREVITPYVEARGGNTFRDGAPHGAEADYADPTNAFVVGHSQPPAFRMVSSRG